MQLPAFFDAAPRITLRDPLAHLLGAAEEGVIEYAYADAVKLAGHSCPTVASAYLLTRAALAALYPGATAVQPATLPERGGIRVEFHETQAAGVTGVTALVAGLITGAAQESGFKGIGGHFDRRGLLFFGVDVTGEIRFARVDTGVAVTVSTRLDRLPADPRMAPLMARCITGAATDTESTLFRSLWQDRVRRLVVEHADDPEIISVKH
jgi:hypothetical protein